VSSSTPHTALPPAEVTVHSGTGVQHRTRKRVVLSCPCSECCTHSHTAQSGCYWVRTVTASTAIPSSTLTQNDKQLRNSGPATTAMRTGDINIDITNDCKQSSGHRKDRATCKSRLHSCTSSASSACSCSSCSTRHTRTPNHFHIAAYPENPAAGLTFATHHQFHSSNFHSTN